MNSKVVIRSSLLWLTGALLVVISYVNIWGFGRFIASPAIRHSQDELAVQAVRYENVRNELLKAGYRSGTVGFITNRDLNSQPPRDQDGFRWSQAQFTLLPWIVVHGGRAVSGIPVKPSVPFVIGDFWDGTPSASPPGLIPIYKSEDGLMLFKRKPQE